MQADLGICGVGTMGGNLALNIAEHGYTVAVYDASPERAAAVAAAGNGMLLPCRTPGELLTALRRPAAVILTVWAGKATDDAIASLRPFLSPNDILLDAGNSHPHDTRRRHDALIDNGIAFLGLGLSGGGEGARHGPAIMAGGDYMAYGRVEPLLTAIAAKAGGRPCCLYTGPDGSGHYAKMVHNGIEYADMQLIAEAYTVMRHGLGMSHRDMAAVFAGWNRGGTASCLFGITADILGRKDALTGGPLVEVILDAAAQNGTGAWAVESALAIGYPAPTLAEAVFARSLSSRKEERGHAARTLPSAGRTIADPPETAVPALAAALYGAKLAVYAQGFGLLSAAGTAYGWKPPLEGLARAWQGGCIIRCALLERLADAYGRVPDLPSPLFDPALAAAAAENLPHWRSVTALCARAGLAVPAMASALSWYDGLRTDPGPAGLIQAQRNYFGAHPYRRVDRPGMHHTDWHTHGGAPCGENT